MCSYLPSVDVWYKTAILSPDDSLYGEFKSLVEEKGGAFYVGAVSATDIRAAFAFVHLWAYDPNIWEADVEDYDPRSHLMYQPHDTEFDVSVVETKRLYLREETK